MKKFNLKSIYEISAEEQANLIAGAGKECSCSCGSCSCSCSSQAPSGTVKDSTDDIQDGARFVANDANK